LFYLNAAKIVSPIASCSLQQRLCVALWRQAVEACQGVRPLPHPPRPFSVLLLHAKLWRRRPGRRASPSKGGVAQVMGCALVVRLVAPGRDRPGLLVATRMPPGPWHWQRPWSSGSTQCLQAALMRCWLCWRSLGAPLLGPLLRGRGPRRPQLWAACVPASRLLTHPTVPPQVPPPVRAGLPRRR
jgi:hypothetical protein